MLLMTNTSNYSNVMPVYTVNRPIVDDFQQIIPIRLGLELGLVRVSVRVSVKVSVKV
jgi:hypothetical protein